jgi:hypothetical protein
MKKLFTHDEAIAAASAFAERYGVYTFVSDTDFQNKIFEDYSWFGIYPNANDLRLLATVASEQELSNISLLASIVFPVDEQEKVLSHMEEDGLAGEDERLTLTIIRGGFDDK